MASFPFSSHTSPALPSPRLRSSRFPASFTFVLRAFSTLEGIGKTLNPDYKFSDVAQPYAQELLELQDGQKQRDMLISQVRGEATRYWSYRVDITSEVARYTC